jgi:hypothetical protein
VRQRLKENSPTLDAVEFKGYKLPYVMGRTGWVEKKADKEFLLTLDLSATMRTRQRASENDSKDK